MNATTQTLIQTSKDLIRRHQHDLGAYVACPNFPTYRYCWLRDGSFIAYAMLQSGEAQSCGQFLRWVDGVIRKYRGHVIGLQAKTQRGESPAPADFLPTRYTLTGDAQDDGWPNFQIDGYGTWLWCLGEYLSRPGTHADLAEFQESITTTLDYLRVVWKLPNYDCWEEYGDHIHPASLACVYGGLVKMNAVLRDPAIAAWAEDIRRFILTSVLPIGRFPKYFGSNTVDASLLWLALPFEVVPVDDPVMQKTVARIAATLLKDGGVYRYAEDTYYGGGRWIILSCWLAWYYLRCGNRPAAQALVKWVETQADEAGQLPEQVSTLAHDPDFLPFWEQLWGPSARPLLWSHAMYLIVQSESALKA